MSWCQQSEDDDERKLMMSAASCRTGTPVLCHAHSMPEHTNVTGYAPGHATSGAPVVVELRVLTSGASRQTEWCHSAQTAVGAAGIKRY